jgi:hypothetical protein
MSEIKLNLLDSHTSIRATVHGSVGDALVAALSAEPKTVDELEVALRNSKGVQRFRHLSLIAVKAARLTRRLTMPGFW